MEGVDLSGIEVWYLRELAYKVSENLHAVEFRFKSSSRSL